MSIYSAYHSFGKVITFHILFAILFGKKKTSKNIYNLNIREINFQQQTKKKIKIEQKLLKNLTLGKTYNNV